MDSSKHHIPEEAKEKDEEKEKRPQGAGDWILELFSPTYANAAAVLDGKHEVTEEGPRIKMVSAFDPQSIKNVYDRVHMMIKLEEELKKEKAQAGKESEGSATKKRHTETTADSKRENLQDSAIWNAEELSVLRGVFRAAKSQLSGLEVKLRQTQRHNAELEEKLASQATLLDTKSKKLTEATKANHRLKIHCEELQLEVRSMVMKLEAVTEMWREIDQEKLRMMQENQEHRIALDKERMARHQLEIQLQEASQEIAREKMLAEENAKTRYEHHIHKLKEELVKTEDELEGERQLHSQNKRALEHLRNHFASLPLCDVLPPGVVDRDQVAFIDHVSL